MVAHRVLAVRVASLQAKGVATVVDGWQESDVLAVLPDDLPERGGRGWKP